MHHATVVVGHTQQVSGLLNPVLRQQAAGHLVDHDLDVGVTVGACLGVVVTEHVPQFVCHYAEVFTAYADGDFLGRVLIGSEVLLAYEA